MATATAKATERQYKAIPWQKIKVAYERGDLIAKMAVRFGYNKPEDKDPNHEMRGIIGRGKANGFRDNDGKTVFLLDKVRHASMKELGLTSRGLPLDGSKKKAKVKTVAAPKPAKQPKVVKANKTKTKSIGIMLSEDGNFVRLEVGTHKLLVTADKFVQGATQVVNQLGYKVVKQAAEVAEIEENFTLTPVAGGEGPKEPAEPEVAAEPAAEVEEVPEPEEAPAPIEESLDDQVLVDGLPVTTAA